MTDTFTEQRISDAILDTCTSDTASWWDMIKCHKPHKCDYCGHEIQKGEQARYYEGRAPRYDDNDNQVGISYYRGWLCADYGECEARYLEREGESNA